MTDPVSIIIVAIGLPFTIGGYLLTRAYCRALASRPSPQRYSRRAALLNEVPRF